MNQRGFIAADFLFSFVLVIGCGIIIFAFTFSLATVEIGQYITWSAARAYSAAATKSVAGAAGSSEAAGRLKFLNLQKQFPLLTGAGSQGSAWFEITLTDIGDEAYSGLTDVNINNNYQSRAERRQPWIGVQSQIELKLFKSLQIPFIGKLATDEDVFKFPMRAFLLRNPSQDECLSFFQKRFHEGIKKMDDAWKNSPYRFEETEYTPIEDNGC